MTPQLRIVHAPGPAEAQAQRRRPTPPQVEGSAARAYSPPPRSRQERTIGELVDAFWQRNAANYKEGKSRSERERNLRRFKEALGHFPAGELPEDEDDPRPLAYTDWVEQNWPSSSTRRCVNAIVQRVMNWSISRKLLKPGGNPFAGITWEEGEPRRPTTDNEFLALLRGRPKGTKLPAGYQPDHNFQRLLMAMRLSKGRPGEMEGLLWTEVDLENGVILKADHKTRRHTKKASPIVMGNRLWRLMLWLRRRDPHGTEHVFRNQKGTAWNGSNTSTKMQRLRRRAGVSPEATLHGLRHRAGTDGVANGESTMMVSKLLRHGSQRTTEKFYVQIGTGQLAELRTIADRIDRLNVRKN